MEKTKEGTYTDVHGLGLSFRLDPDFLDEFRDAEVDWGYGVLSELVYLRSYSRIKDARTNSAWPYDHKDLQGFAKDENYGGKERWWETCERVISGMYSIQKDYILSQNMTWNEEQAQRSAQEAYRRMFAFKWTPPGRGLWAMGTYLVNGKGDSSALYNCFSGDTEIITEDGIRALGELAGTNVTLLTTDGNWVDAPVRDFGVQKLRKVTLSRGGVEKVVFATPNHRWRVRDKRKKESRWKTVETDELNTNHALPTVYANVDKVISHEGVRSGFIFGDGTLQSSYSVAYFCGDKDDELIPYFSDYEVRERLDGVKYIPGLPKECKVLPNSREYNKDYLYGWLAGYFAADGHMSTDGQAVLASSNKRNLEAVRDICSVLGIGTYKIRQYKRLGYGKEETWIYYIGFVTNTLDEEFFLLKHHRERYKEPKQESRWLVKSVEDTDREETVYCATVPDTGEFALADNVLTPNCHFVSTEDIGEDFAEPFTHLMHASMMGGGVGWDTEGQYMGRLFQPSGAIPYKIPDSAEGWVKSVELLLKAYQGGPMPHFDYSGIRPEGEPIITFGGVAPGPEPLKKAHEYIKDLMDDALSQNKAVVMSRLIADVMNIIGVAVVSGNVRRSSEIGLASYGDTDFWTLKDFTRPENEYRSEWGWMSNNSLKVHDHTAVDFDAVVKKINTGYDTWNKGAGEPGLFFIDNARNFGRMNNGPDYADGGVKGCNPCGEIALEDHEACNVAEGYLMNHDNLQDWLTTLKYLYLYCKTVTLLPTKWPKTNEVQMRNRRIGVSMTGTAHFVDTKGYDVLKEWSDKGYKAIKDWDEVYSRWLCVRESIRVTTSKPSGTVSLLAGTTAGVHWPTAEHYIRRMMLPKDFPLLDELNRAGYRIETSVQSPDTSVVIEVPISVSGVRPESEVSVYEKVGLVSFVQKWWADNMVSNTIVYDPINEVGDLANALKMHASELKSVSALPRDTSSYEQLPEEWVHPEWLDDYRDKLDDVDFDIVYNGNVAIDDAVKMEGCDSDVCELKL